MLWVQLKRAFEGCSPEWHGKAFVVFPTVQGNADAFLPSWHLTKTSCGCNHFTQLIPALLKHHVLFTFKSDYRFQNASICCFINVFCPWSPYKNFCNHHFFKINSVRLISALCGRTYLFQNPWETYKLTKLALCSMTQSIICIWLCWHKSTRK